MVKGTWDRLGAGKGKGRTAVGFSFAITAYQALAS